MQERSCALEDKVAFLSRLSLLARFRWRIDQFLLRVHREGGDVEGSSRIVLGVKGQALSGGKVEDVLLHGVYELVHSSCHVMVYPSDVPSA
jgi:hypothetical protein